MSGEPLFQDLIHRFFRSTNVRSSSCNIQFSNLRFYARLQNIIDNENFKALMKERLWKGVLNMNAKGISYVVTKANMIAAFGE